MGPPESGAGVPLSSEVTGAPPPIRAGLAMAVGAGLGVALAGGNVYAGLKTGYIDGGSISAALVGSMLLGLIGRRAASRLEVNLTQTVASSAAVMSFATGVCAPIPAMALAGHTPSGWVVLAWGMALAAIGVALACWLRARLIEGEQLPFPTGQATAEMIRVLSDGRGRGRGRLLSLALAAGVAGTVTFFRDSPGAFVPGGWVPGLTVMGIAAGALTLGVSISPLLISTGVLIGLRNALSMGLGAAVAWAVLAPLAVRNGSAAEASYAALVPVLLWPGLALMVASSLCGLALSWRTLGRAWQDLRQPLRRSAGARPDSGEARRGVRTRAIMLLAALALVPLLGLGHLAFGIPPLALLLLVPAAIVLSAAAARAAGETDQAPVGQVGSLAQLAMGGQGYLPSVAGGGLVAGVATQTAQTLWALKAGHRLGAAPGLQIAAQLLGAVVGGLVVVPVYMLVVAAYPLGSERMPAPAALAWKATAEAAQGALPIGQPFVWKLTLAAGLVGIVLSLLGRQRRWLPSATAIGAAFVLPASMSMAMVVGAVLMAGVARHRPSWAEAHGASVGAGGIAGESLIGLLLAALAVFGAS